jgi:hypothetical protein
MEKGTIRREPTLLQLIFGKTGSSRQLYSFDSIQEFKDELVTMDDWFFPRIMYCKIQGEVADVMRATSDSAIKLSDSTGDFTIFAGYDGFENGKLRGSVGSLYAIKPGNNIEAYLFRIDPTRLHVALLKEVD